MREAWAGRGPAMGQACAWRGLRLGDALYRW